MTIWYSTCRSSGSAAAPPPPSCPPAPRLPVVPWVQREREGIGAAGEGLARPAPDGEQLVRREAESAQAGRQGIGAGRRGGAGGRWRRGARSGGAAGPYGRRLPLGSRRAAPLAEPDAPAAAGSRRPGTGWCCWVRSVRASRVLQPVAGRPAGAPTGWGAP